MLKEYEQLKASCIVMKRSSKERASAICQKKMKQTTLSEVSERTLNFDNLIVDFVIETMTPVSILESKSFEKLIESASKLTKTPKIMGRCSLVRRIENEYQQAMTKLKQSLQIANFVCTTADIWSSSKRSYLGMTVHWIDSDTLKRKRAVIACRRFKGSHIYDKLAEIISEIHSEFDLKLYKIVKTITDNGLNMIKAFKMFGKSESIILLSEQGQQSDNYNTTSYDNDDNKENEIDEDNDLLPQAFPESVEKNIGDYELPNYERCATHTLHLIAAVDIKQEMAENNAYKKVHNSTFGKSSTLEFMFEISKSL